MTDDTLTLEMLGWNESLTQSFAPFQAKGLEPARVTIEDKHYYVVITPKGELSAQIAGKMHHTAKSEADLPKVGDWVAINIFPDEAKAVIHHTLPRKTKLSRKVSGRETKEQVLATNIDYAFVVQGLDATFNPRLIERHLSTVMDSGAKAIVVLNKADLCDDPDAKVTLAQTVAGEAPVIAASAVTGKGIKRMRDYIKPGITVVFIGSSGVGKSSLINRLYGEEIQATTEVRESDAKGRHTTSWRELIILPDGGLVIDTPGMREFHMWIAGEGLHESFTDIDEIAVRCHFTNCTHTKEKKCAVLDAVANGQLPKERYESYLKLKRELEYLEVAQHEYSQRERKRQTKMAQRAFQKWTPHKPGE